MTISILATYGKGMLKNKWKITEEEHLSCAKVNFNALNLSEIGTTYVGGQHYILHVTTCGKYL